MSSSPTTKAAEKEHKDNKENNFSPFLESVGWREEWATQIDLKLPGWMSYPNSLMELFGLEKRITKPPISQTKADLWKF